MTDDSIGLLICDDHRILTDALASVVRADAGVKLVADPVDNAEDAVALAAQHRPDVVVMDVELAGPVNGLEATRRIKAVSTRSKVIVVCRYQRATLFVETVEG